MVWRLQPIILAYLEEVVVGDLLCPRRPLLAVSHLSITQLLQRLTGLGRMLLRLEILLSGRNAFLFVLLSGASHRRFPLLLCRHLGDASMRVNTVVLLLIWVAVPQQIHDLILVVLLLKQDHLLPPKFFLIERPLPLVNIGCLSLKLDMIILIPTEGLPCVLSV